MTRKPSPKLVLLGGCLLAFGASFVNIGFLLQTGASVSHLTGDISRLATELVSNGPNAGESLPLVCGATVSFVLGATVSGYLLQHPQLELEKPYGRLVSGLGLLLLLAYFANLKSVTAALSLAGFTCGMQNALATRYRGIVLRTTHLTGLLTDLGAFIGMRLRGHQIEYWKLFVPFFLSLSFLLGAISSSALVLYTHLSWLLVAGGSYALGGLAWTIYKHGFSRWRKHPVTPSPSP